MTEDQQGVRRSRRKLGLLTLAAVTVAVVITVGAVRIVGSTRRSASPSGASAAHSLRTTPTPTATTPPATTATPTSSTPTSSAPGRVRSLPVGITFGDRLFGLSPARIGRALDDVVALHMTWMRVDMSWADLQPVSADSFDWAPLDRIVTSARRHKLIVLGLLTYTPAWARSPGCSTFTCPPRSAARFAQFAAAVASRYRDDGVTNYQVWNQPNITLFWRAPDPLRYRSLLAATVTALRATGRGLRIVLGGLAVTHDAGGNLSAETFLRRACAGRTCRVDAVGYDPYTYPSLPSSTDPPLNAVQQLVDPAAGAAGMRATLAAIGLASTPVWFTGFGAPTRQSGTADPRAVSEATQAAIVTDGLRLARSATGVIGGYFIDTLRDSREGGSTSDHFGLERYDGSHKPAFAALASELAA